jgi:hypothetical protein
MTMTLPRAAVVGAIVATTAAAAVAISYPVLLRRRCLTWGATGQEATDEMPGDDLLPDPDLLSTRAITIDAPPEAIWPWLVQMGSGRGGAYTYDWIENALGLNMHSADEILPQYQELKTGDMLPVGANGPRMRVAVLRPGHALVFASEDGSWVWAFGLSPLNATSTRLISRNRIAAPPSSALARRVYELLMEPGSLIMERKMLLGIKHRAEAPITEGRTAVPEPIS